MASPQKMTAQGVRDLNHTGPKEKSAPAVDPVPETAAVDDAQPALASPAPGNDDAPDESALHHG